MDPDPFYRRRLGRDSNRVEVSRAKPAGRPVVAGRTRCRVPGRRSATITAAPRGSSGPGGAGHPDTRCRAEYLRRLSTVLEERLAEAAGG